MIFLDTIISNLKTTPDKVILKEVYHDTIEEITSQKLFQLIQSAAFSIDRSGITPGDRVALIAPNSAQYIAVDLAILLTGSISVPLYHRQTTDEKIDILKDAGTTLVIVQNEESVAEIKDKWDDAPKIISFASLFSKNGVEYSFKKIDSTKPAMIIYTSGTSGKSKGVLLSGENLDFMFPRLTGMIDKFGYWKKDKKIEEIVFHYLPLCFLPSRLAVLSYLYRNVAVSLCMDINNLKEALGKVNPHCFFSVPMILDRIRRGVEEKISQRTKFISWLFAKGSKAFQNITNDDGSILDTIVYALANAILFRKIKKLIGSNLTIIVSGSAPLSAETQEWFRMIGIMVCQAYGMTETSGVATSDNPQRGITAGHIGYPLEGTEVKISNEGELLLKGPHIFQGYWNNPDETKKAIKDDWLHTGDLAECDETGNYKIIGRANNLIVLSSAHNIPSEPLENMLVEHYPRIKQTMLVGNGRPYLIALITGDIKEKEFDSSLKELNEKLPHYKQIRKFFVCPYEFTPENGLLTANLKMKRKKIEEHFQSEVEKLYSD